MVGRHPLGWIAIGVERAALDLHDLRQTQPSGLQTLMGFFTIAPKRSALQATPYRRGRSMSSEGASELEVLDYLELFNSTVMTSSLLGMSQSTCSRRYRSFSERFDLGFDRVNHRYLASRNLDVLQHLRQAAQRLRIRNARARAVRGWQLGALPLPSLSSLGVELDCRPMNSWTVLSMLEQRLLDVAVMGISEFQHHLPTQLSALRATRCSIGNNILCIPICLWKWNLIARDDHPLRLIESPGQQDLSSFPSPALPIGSAPLLMSSLHAHGLASQLCSLENYAEDQWEGFGREPCALSYAAPFSLPMLKAQYGLKALGKSLPILECLAIVGHRDVLSDQAFGSFFKTVMHDLSRSINPSGSSLQWLL